MLRHVAVVVLWCVLTVTGDEFHEPTHTQTIRLLSPRQGQLFSSRGEELAVVFAAPEFAWVRILIDQVEVVRTNNSNQGLISGVGPGLHMVEAELFHSDGHVIAVDTVDIEVCNCVAQEQASKSPVPLPPLENPLDPDLRFMHHEVLYKYGRWQGEFEHGYLTDWLGVRTRYEWDCIRTGGYYKFVPSRRLECENYDRNLEMAEDGPHYIRGFLPPVDDEYPEYVDVLRSVERSKGAHFVVMELGASWGTWGVRAVSAYRRLFPRGSYQMVGVESALHRFRQMEQHVLANNVANASCLHAFVTGGPAMTPGNPVSPFHSSYAIGEPRAISMQALLQPFDHVDYLDFDIQGAELDVLMDPAAFEAIAAKVYAVHVGTHRRSRELAGWCKGSNSVWDPSLDSRARAVLTVGASSVQIHAAVRDLFLAAEWGLELDLAHNPEMVRCDQSVTATGDYTWDWLQRNPSCLTQTEQGRMYVRDGLLSFYNPRFGALYE